jgi:predicted transcriptional regulator
MFPSSIGDISKGNASPESQDAFKRIEKGRLPAITRVVEMLRISGPMTSKEIAKRMGVPIHFVSGRISEAKAMGLIEKTGLRREHSAVVCATERQRKLAL